MRLPHPTDLQWLPLNAPLGRRWRLGLRALISTSMSWPGVQLASMVTTAATAPRWSGKWTLPTGDQHHHPPDGSWSVVAQYAPTKPGFRPAMSGWYMPSNNAYGRCRYCSSCRGLPRTRAVPTVSGDVGGLLAACVEFSRPKPLCGASTARLEHPDAIHRSRGPGCLARSGRGLARFLKVSPLPLVACAIQWLCLSRAVERVPTYRAACRRI